MITPALCALRDAFQRHDREIKIVGGAVRSLLLGETPADIDLCTDADPDEQEHIYQAENIKHFPTGVRHGTWTIQLHDSTTVEVTSLRTETEHDGRHAVMNWTRDWQEDLSRRDLTINAIAMAFDGTLCDPFGGASDLQQRLVRFVGDPEKRIREDYLRILRFFRFHARIAADQPYDPMTLAAITGNSYGLRDISRERIWAECSKIIGGPYGVKTLYDLIDLGIADHIGLPKQKLAVLHPEVEYQNSREPESLMAAHLGSKYAVEAQARMWRWSTKERDQASSVADVLNTRPNMTLRGAQSLVIQGVFKLYLAEAFRMIGKLDDAAALTLWPIPEFPVRGADLLSHGLAEDRKLGTVLRALRDHWDRSDYRLTKAELLQLIPSVEDA